MKTNIISWIALVLGVVALAFSLTQFINSDAGTLSRQPYRVIGTGGGGGTGGNCPPENPVEICTNTGAGGTGGVCWCGSYQ